MTTAEPQNPPLNQAADVTLPLRQRLIESGCQMEETHISWVLLGPEDVWKIKKPVDLGFLDFSTPERRHRACEAEVQLNQRLAPDVYLGVSAITADSSGRLEIDGRGSVVDWAVHMRRLSHRNRADTMLREGRLEPEHLQSVARRLAEFHALEPARPEFGQVDVVARNVRENFDQTQHLLSRYLSPSEIDQVSADQVGFLETRSQLFQERIRRGRVRDGHGDLRLEHIYFESAGSEDGGELTIVDCIEFNRRFRYADVCSDVAFLAMDLTSKDRPDLAEVFLAAYARWSEDYDLYEAVDFYESYRAFVRGKVWAFMAEAPGKVDEKKRAAEQARRFFVLALASARRSTVEPTLWAVGGHIAAGKSTVAFRLGQDLAAPVIGSDRTRKHLLGVEPHTQMHVSPFSGPYDEATHRRVYAEVLRRARVVLESGRSVVVDASFSRAEDRLAFRDLALELQASFTYVECRAQASVRRQRLVERRRQTSVSDGRLEIMDALADRWEPVTELAEHEKVTIHTDRDDGDSSSSVLQQILHARGRRPGAAFSDPI